MEKTEESSHREIIQRSVKQDATDRVKNKIQALLG